jgi:hypothetical protein
MGVVMLEDRQMYVFSREEFPWPLRVVCIGAEMRVEGIEMSPLKRDSKCRWRNGEICILDLSLVMGNFLVIPSGVVNMLLRTLIVSIWMFCI